LEAAPIAIGAQSQKDRQRSCDLERHLAKYLIQL
jgi:hypothetical protein